MKGVLTN